MKIYCFYEKLNDIYIDDLVLDHERVLEVWKKSWSYYGWEPIVLTRKDIPKNEDYEILSKTIKKLPTTNSFRYEEICYLRWLAMLGKKGWFCDYDMINYGFTPCSYGNKIVSVTKSGNLGASVVYGPESFYKKIVETIKNFDFENFKSLPSAQYLKPFNHISDMVILNALFKADIELRIMRESPMDFNLILKHYNYDNCKEGKYKAILKDPRAKVFL